MTHKLPNLPWQKAALEPNYLASTLDFHYGKHHQAYVDKLNIALEGTGMENLSIEELMMRVKEVPEAKRQAVINNGGGHYNHSLFWTILGTGSSDKPSGKIAERINQDFGSYDSFVEKFTASAIACFGSGWTWLTVNPDGSLNIENSSNQDNCLMNSNRKPVLVIDLWEHAYYLEHQNRRPDFIKAFFKMINWKQVEENYQNALAKKSILNLNETLKV
jgi:superoxide dismutase, Fe-Mn family